MENGRLNRLGGMIMRELRICMEINGLTEDEKGNSCPGGMSLSLGMVPDENFEASTSNSSLT